MAGLVEELQALSVEVRDEDLANVATVSAGGNEVVSPAPPARYVPSEPSLGLEMTRTAFQTVCWQGLAEQDAARTRR